VTNQIEEHLDRLRTASESCVEATLRDHQADLGEVHLVDEDASQWLAKISGPEREQIMAARRELALAEYSIASGLYRQAFATLRLFLELSFAAVHFSVNEFERRQWLSDRTDFSWSTALDENNGVLSKGFVLEFFPGLADHAKTYAEAAASCYRYCSQFVHGKAAVAQGMPESLEYRGPVVIDWCHRAKQAGEAVLFLFLIRYGRDALAHEDDALSDLLSNRFGHLPPVRELLGLAGDQ
jgi:hypothetical protein